MKTKTPNISPDTRKKFRKIIDFLRYGLLEEQFDMRCIENECGTAGCVMGWAPTIFPGQGLNLQERGRGAYLVIDTPAGLSCGFVGFGDFLGITRDDCENLFHGRFGQSKESPDATADRLEEYLRTGVAR